MTDRHEEHGTSRMATKASVRLSPPPRIGRTGDRRSDLDGPGGPKEPRPRGIRYWLTLLVFLGLGATAIAVFVLLPSWVSERTAREKATIAAAESAPAPPALTSTSPTSTSEAQADRSTPVAPQAPAVASETPPGPARQPSPAPTRDPAPSDFARAMAEGLRRLEEGELEEARRAFQQAQALSSGAPEATEGIARVEAEQQLVAITDHQERAGTFEEEEHWDQAAAEYVAVLALDPTLRFAQLGQQRANERRDLSRRLRSHLARPDRLSSDRVLEDARELLAEAGRIEPVGPVLLEQTGRLREQIEIASTPLRVILLSDNLTEVTVYRVGRLGRFERRELDLRPGSYIIVGTRAGFRDVRERLDVEPGGSPHSLTVRCEEVI